MVCFRENSLATLDLQSALFLPHTVWAANLISTVIRIYVHQVFTLLSVFVGILQKMCLNTKWQFYSSFAWFVTCKILVCADPPVWFLSAFYQLHALHFYIVYILMSLDVHWRISDQSCILLYTQLGILVLASGLTQWTSIPDPYYA